MMKEQEEYLDLLADNYTQEAGILLEQEVRLKIALFEVEEKQRIVLKTFTTKVGNLMTRLYEEQDLEFHQKLIEAGLPTNKFFKNFVLSISRIVLFFEKIFKKNNDLGLERSSS